MLVNETAQSRSEVNRRCRVEKSSADILTDAFDDVVEVGFGFDEVIVGAELGGMFFVAELGEGSQEDNFDVHGFVGVFENVEDVETADFGHHHIEEDEVGAEFCGDSESFFAVGDEFCLETF